MEAKSDSPLLDVHQAAAFLNVSERTLWQVTAPRGPLPVVRIGTRMLRYDRADLVTYINQQKQTAR
jgi:predicted DNA-binding transcriptional regulator AlpA